MKNFGIGLALCLGGMAVGIIMAVLVGLARATEGEAPILIRVLMLVGFSTMFLGPVVFWLILPIFGFMRRRREESSHWASVPSADSSVLPQ